MTKQLLGKLPPDAFGMLELPVIAGEILDGLRALPDLTAMSSDAMDELSIVGVVPDGVSKLGEIEAHNLAEPGDRLVLQGVDLATMRHDELALPTAREPAQGMVPRRILSAFRLAITH